MPKSTQTTKPAYYLARVDRAARPDGQCPTTWTIRRRLSDGSSRFLTACDTRAQARRDVKALNELTAQPTA